MNLKSASIRRITTAAIVLAFVGQACTLSLFENPLNGGTSTQTPDVVVPSPTPQVMAQTTFIATVPEPLPAGESMAIAIMDEVTGLSLNATQYPMSARDSLTYTATLPLPHNSIVKYRYVRRGASQVLEDTNRGAAIRYRMYFVEGPAEIQDVVADWGDKSYARPTGIVMGQIGYWFIPAESTGHCRRNSIHHRFERAI